MRDRLRLKTNKAQSAAELAIFGSIVIFVIGIILRQAMTTSQQANMPLRAFRMALQESYLTANGQYSDRFSAGRNSASFLILEDRLTVDPSQKQGTRDRVPLFAQGSGTMTHTSMMSVDLTDIDDQPVYDMIINGQRFPFLTGRVVTHRLCLEGSDSCNPTDIKVPACKDYGVSTNPDVFEVHGEGKLFCYCNDPVFCREYDSVDYQNQFIFFYQAYNGENQEIDGLNWDPDIESRLDLNLDGVLDDVPDVNDYINSTSSGPPPINNPGIDLRKHFMWQWIPVRDEALEEGISIDIDGDYKTEKIIARTKITEALELEVYDSQEGDIDGTADDQTEQIYIEEREAAGEVNVKYTSPGLGNSTRMFSFAKDGTLLQTLEGDAALAPDGQFIRNEMRQDNLDIIERVINLSNNTGRFCSDGTGDPGVCPGPNCIPTDWTSTDTSTINWARSQGLYRMTNPVEACDQCFSVVNKEDRQKLTCMETREPPTIFVRSRIRDRRRSTWITRIGERED